MAKDIADLGSVDPLAKPDWAMSRRERAAAERARLGHPVRRRWPAVLVVALLAVVGAAAWWWRSPEAAPSVPTTEATQPAVMQINRDEWTTLEPATLRRTVEVLGSLRPWQRADLSAETGGRVDEVAVRPGDAVEPGATLVQVDVQRLTLDMTLARSNAEATRAQLGLAQRQLERQQALVGRGVAAEASLEDLQASIAAQQATLAAQEDQIRAAEIALAGATVRAPFAGVVASRSVEPGTVVAAGTPLLTIVDPTRMEMVASAPVAAGAQLRPGQRVDLEVDGVEGRTFAGVVERIAPVAEEGTRTLTAFVAVDNADGALVGGMFGTGAIVVAEATDALAVPRTALREDDSGTHVLAIVGDALARRDVSVGESWQGDLVQVQGLTAGERIVTAALPDLEAGQPVELVDF
ncbi:efflux RND transporter periplasmic adaptor subunit [Rubellimicrobium arenae]|uniref:efflux RND transporter periplasmic adaptor subunit n=1 Tax=Rubellimicrobium arenae TaxID=2817372 RepID=UPI001B311A4B|nr:efflux RND transporter periplasmic adaptor subunit [Rubellimicrobium arenae]